MEYFILAFIVFGFIGLAIYLKKPKSNPEHQLEEKNAKILALEKELVEVIALLGLTPSSQRHSKNSFRQKTKMNCLEKTIKNSLDHAYAHHIQRLMITRNG